MKPESEGKHRKSDAEQFQREMAVLKEQMERERSENKQFIHEAAPDEDKTRRLSARWLRARTFFFPHIV